MIKCDCIKIITEKIKLNEIRFSFNKIETVNFESMNLLTGILSENLILTTINKRGHKKIERKFLLHNFCPFCGIKH